MPEIFTWQLTLYSRSVISVGWLVVVSAALLCLLLVLLPPPLLLPPLPVRDCVPHILIFQLFLTIHILAGCCCLNQNTHTQTHNGRHDSAARLPLPPDRRRARGLLPQEEGGQPQDRARGHPRRRPLQVRAMGTTRCVCTCY